MPYCKICNTWNCEEHEFKVGRTIAWKKEFSGSSPPEIFVGRWNYPNVYTGILAPEEYGDTHSYSSAESWHEQKLSIPEIMSFRNKLIYARMQGNIKKLPTAFNEVFKEIAMTHKSVATAFTLQKPVAPHGEQETSVPLIARAAPLDTARLEENAPVKSRVDYLVRDEEAKSSTAIKELYKSGIPVSNIMKLLSAGLLGRKKARKLVPTRWSITAVDDTLSKEKLEKIKTYQELGHIELFHGDYLGNHYVFLLLPSTLAFEVIELATGHSGVSQDYESFEGRKKYADSVTGAYYVNRLALAEYLEKIKRQCSCLVMREVRPEYYAPCGVGILRELSRECFKSKPETFSTTAEALQYAQTKFKVPLSRFTEPSWLLKNHGKQKRLTEFF